MATGGVTLATGPTVQLLKEDDSSSCDVQRQSVALPLHVQTLQRALNVDRLIDQVEKVLGESLENSREGYEILKSTKTFITRATAKNGKQRKGRQFNFSRVAEERKWVQVCVSTVVHNVK